MNKVILLGNLTRDVEIRNTSGNNLVAQFGIACNRKFKTAGGEAREEVTFVDCEAWGKTGEVIKQYFTKGAQILVEGRLKLDQWDDKESGAKRSKLKVVVESFSFVGSKPAAGAENGGGRASTPAPIPDEDIPF